MTTLSRRLGAHLLPLLITAGIGLPVAAQSRLTPGRHSLYLAAADGTQLAVEVWLPEAAATSRVHAVLRLTRYWRATEYRNAAAAAADVYEQLAGAYLSQGLAVVAVDARGTGASFGVNPGPWSAAEQADAVRVLDWIAAQPWSTGRVGAIGTSYDGNSAVLLAATRHPALAAVVARFYDHDPYAGLVFPGGLFNVGFTAPWAAYTRALDAVDLCVLGQLQGQSCEQFRQAVAGPMPVAPERLAAAISGRTDNLDLMAAMARVEFRDQALGASASLEAVSPFRFTAELNAAAVPALVTAGWLDSGTAAGALDAFAARTGPITVVIGAFNHGGFADNDTLRIPRRAADPPVEEQYAEAIGFMIQHCSGAPAVDRVIRYATLGDDKWRTTGVWPPHTVRPRKLQFDDGGRLVESSGLDASGQDTYRTDPGVSTGALNRWTTPLDSAPVNYGDRAAMDARMLTYTTEPLTRDTRLTGTPVLRLRMSVDAADAAVIAYLEAVDTAGVSRYVTEGELRLTQRAAGFPGSGAERLSGRTYRRDAARPYAPGTTVDLLIPLQPTSALLRAGQRLRIAIAGGDAGTFVPVTPQDARFTLHRGGSWLELPVDSAP